MNRREFLAAPLALSAKPPWVDPSIAQLPKRPWRKIHLDFHNSQYVMKIGERFNADEFGDTLVKANVNSIVVFAKDMHGYFYYPSKYGPVHPGLSFDLLGAQVEACRKRKIAVYAYYCTTWDNHLAEHHPEWLVIKRDRTNYLPKFDQTPGWTALCLAYDGFVKLMLDHTREFVSRYELDGAWFDMPVPIAQECFCRECLRQLRARGLDPFSREVQCRHKHELHKAFIARIHETVTTARKGCQVDFNGQAVYGLGERARFMDNIDLEALPSGANWGYYYFPLVVRYTRTFGLTTYGMTGRFKATWADFGGLKLPAQLDVELASIVANAARCDIGDQMPPGGRLDPAVYHVIGECYEKIRRIEPYLEGAAPVTEAAMLVSGLPLEHPNTDAHLGLTKLLMELRVQFDAVEPLSPWERYGMIVVPETLAVNEALAARLQQYAETGGALIVCDRGGVIAGTERSWLEKYGLRYAGQSPFKPAYMITPEGFTGDIPPYEYALYQGASQWTAPPPARVVARLGEPAFQRAPEHYTSHRQSPFDHATGYAAVARSGNIALLAFPAGASYFAEGYWIYRHTLRRMIDEVLPQRLIESDAPVSAELTVTRQRSRWLVHIVNWHANRGTPRHPVFHEEPAPLTNIRVKLNVPLRAASARAVISGAALPVREVSGGVEITVPRVPVHEIVVFEA
jgi:hypothetical protein